MIAGRLSVRLPFFNFGENCNSIFPFFLSLASICAYVWVCVGPCLALTRYTLLLDLWIVTCRSLIYLFILSLCVVGVLLYLLFVYGISVINFDPNAFTHVWQCLSVEYCKELDKLFTFSMHVCLVVSLFLSRPGNSFFILSVTKCMCVCVSVCMCTSFFSNFPLSLLKIIAFASYIEYVLWCHLHFVTYPFDIDGWNERKSKW